MGKITERIVAKQNSHGSKITKFVKKMFSRQRRKEAKDYLNDFSEDKPEPETKNRYEGWTN